MNKDLARNLRRYGLIQAGAAWTVTPLLGFVVGDHRPDLDATVLHMFVAVAIYFVGTIPTLREMATGRRPVQRSGDPDWELAARAKAHQLGLPWLEADGTISTAESARVQREHDRPDPHREIHERRLAAQPDVTRVGTRGGDTHVWRVDAAAMAGATFEQAYRAGLAMHAIGIPQSQWGPTLRDNLEHTAPARDHVTTHARDCACFDVAGQRVVGFTDPRCKRRPATVRVAIDRSAARRQLDRFAHMGAERLRLLACCRPATVAEYRAWTVGYRARGGRFTDTYDYPTPASLMVLERHPGVLPELYGAASVEVIVPSGVMFRHEVPNTFHGAHGHSTFFFMDGFEVVGTTVPHYNDL